MASLFEDMLDAYTRGVTKVNEWVGAPLEPVRNAANNVNAGIISAIPSAPAAVDLLRAVTSAAIQSFDRPDDQSYIDALGENFSNEVVSPEAVYKLNMLVEEKTQEFVKQNPTATVSEQNEFRDQYKKSDEFMKATYDNMSWGLGFGMKAQWAANEIAGVNKRPDELTPAESGLQILGQSAVGLTQGIVNDITKATTKVVGEKIVNNAIARTGARVVEAVTPLTLPLTPKNVGINTGVGVALDNAINYATGNDTLFSSMEKAKVAQDATKVAEATTPYDPNTAAPSPEHTVDAGVGILGAAALLFGGRASKAVGSLVAKNADEAFLDAVSTATKNAPTLAEQSTSLKPTINNETSDVFDSLKPVTDVMKKLGAQPNDLADTDAVVSAASGYNRGVHLSNAFNYGKLANVSDTVPLKAMIETIDGLAPEDGDLLYKYMWAQNRKADSALQAKTFQQEVADAQTAYTQAVATGNRRTIRAAEKDLTEKMQTRQLQMTDDPSIRPNMEQWSNEEVDEIIRIGNNNPAVKKLAELSKQASADINNYRYRNGTIDLATRDALTKTRPYYLPLAEADYAGLSGLERGKAMLKNSFNDLMNGTENASDPGRKRNIARNVSGEGSKVNQPRSIQEALQEMYYSAVNEVTVNNARRDTIDRMLALGGEGVALRRAGHNVDVSGKPHVSFKRDGREERWILADAALGRALDFAPMSAIPILNQSRKIAQQFTTGKYALWFAPKAFAWDNAIAAVATPAGRSMGIIDTLARRLATGTSAESVVNSAMDYIPSFTAPLASLSAIPYNAGMKAAHAVGQLVARDLLGNNKFLAAIAQADPRFAKVVEAAGDHMAMAFDRSMYNLYHQNIAGNTYGNDVAINNLTRVEGKLRKLGKVGGTLLKPYTTAVELIHEATKTSFFYQNYGLLDLKYNGNIPADEMRRLIRDTKQLTGDMSRASGRKRIQQAASVVPYANATIQGSRFMLRGLDPRSPNSGKMWSRMIGFALPVVGAYAFLDSWKGAADYWNNKVQPYQRVTGIPYPKLSVLAEAQQTGKMPEFSPDKLDIMPMPPEFSMVIEPFITGMRSLGLLGGNNSLGLGSPMDQLAQAVKQITSFTTPPAIEAILAYNGMTTKFGGVQPVADNTGGQGAGSDMMSPDSDISSTLYNVISSLLGTSANIGMQTLNAFDISDAKQGDFTQAFNDAMDVGLSEVKNRMPSVSVPGLWDAQRRYSSSTPEADYIYKALDALTPVFNQISVDRDRKGGIAGREARGLDTPNSISNPLLSQLSEVVYTQLKQKGTFKGLTDLYTETRKTMQDLERMRSTANQEKWLQQRNRLVMQQQDIRHQQARYLQKLENTLAVQAGPAFQQQFGMPFSFNNLSKLVYKDVQSQR